MKDLRLWLGQNYGALLALVLYPIVWLVLLPFRLVGIVVDGVFEFLRSLVLLPSRALGSRP